MSGIIHEKYLNNSPNFVSFEIHEKILNQMKKSVVKIYNGNSTGSGFLIKIPYNSNILTVLMTNNHVFNKKDFETEKSIKLSLYKQEIKIINLDKRIFYTNKFLDVTIIEIQKNKDGFQDDNFLELDNKILDSLLNDINETSNYFENLYLSESLYLIGFPEKNEISVSYSEPAEIKDIYIFHKCNTRRGSSGSPIFLSDNGKVIGIHFGGVEKKEINVGTLLIFPIFEFIKGKKIIIGKKDNNGFLNKIVKPLEFILKEAISSSLIINQSNTFIDNYLNNLNSKFSPQEEIKDINEFHICETIGEKPYKYYVENFKYLNDSFYFMTTVYKSIYKHICYIISNTNNEVLEPGILIKTGNQYNFFDFPLLIMESKIFEKMNKEGLIKISYNNKIFNVKLNKDIIYKYDSYIIINLESSNFNFEFDYLLDDKSYLIDNYFFKTNKNENKNLNEITLILKITKENISKKIYFIKEVENISGVVNDPDNNINNNNNLNYFIPEKEGFYRVKLLFKNPIKDCSNMFSGCKILYSVDFTYFNSEKINNMSCMFHFCENLREIRFSKFNTKKVNDMSYMFCGCYNLENIDLSCFNTENVKNMRGMFMLCKKLQNIDLKNFNTANVINMRSMFKYCYSLRNANLTSFNINNVQIVSYMFEKCYNLRELDLSSFDFKHIAKENMQLIFHYMTGLDEKSFEFFLKKKKYIVLFNMGQFK